jgi:hypothetical protein
MPKTSWEVLSAQYTDRSRGSQSQLYFDSLIPLFYLYIKKECHAWRQYSIRQTRVIGFHAVPPVPLGVPQNFGCYIIEDKRKYHI